MDAYRTHPELDLTIVCYAHLDDDGTFRPAIQFCRGTYADDDNDRVILPGSYRTYEEAADAAERATDQAVSEVMRSWSN